MALATVGRGTCTFFMRHGIVSPLRVVVVLGLDGFDLDDRKLLAVAALLFVALTFLLFENDYFFAALVFEDLGGDGCAGEGRGADFEVSAFTEGEYVGDFDGGTGFRVRVPVYNENVSFGNSELLALGFDGRFHK